MPPKLSTRSLASVKGSPPSSASASPYWTAMTGLARMIKRKEDAKAAYRRKYGWDEGGGIEGRFGSDRDEHQGQTVVESRLRLVYRRRVYLALFLGT